MIGAVILAAGASRRMGRPKALLPYPEPDGSESTFVTHLVKVFESSRAEPIVVVLGHDRAEAEKELGTTSARTAFNPRYREGMLSSIQAGIAAIDDGSVDAALICPVDHPAVSPGVIDQLIARFEAHHPPIVVPVFEGRRGHPVLFSREVFAELQKAPKEVGARRVVWDHQKDLVEIEVSDAFVTVDIDTPADYRAFRKTTE